METKKRKCQSDTDKLRNQKLDLKSYKTQVPRCQCRKKQISGKGIMLKSEASCPTTASPYYSNKAE